MIQELARQGIYEGFSGGSGGKELSAVQETRIQSLGWEDPLEKGVATHSSVLAWRTLWTEEPDVLWSIGLQRAGHNLVTDTQMAL